VRRLIPLLLLSAALIVPAASGRTAPRVQTAIFYYPWYGTPTFDGSYRKWSDHGHAAPADIASSFYPARGLYSSGDPATLDAQMRDIARAGVDEVVVSWWGQGSPEDARLAAVAHAARRHGLAVAAHLEPYDGRTLAGTRDDIVYLRTLGIRDFFVYHATDFAPAEWTGLTASLDGVRLFAQTNLVGFAQKGGFDGVYSYDILTSGGAQFRRVCEEAHRVQLLCGPSVGPGYNAKRATGDTRVKLRRRGATYDAMWTAALRSQADLVTITSYNEWLEGTQIESARRRHGYASYDGAWGTHGAASSRAYLERTAYWTSRFARGR
jgi:glycoprotein endo-alpha-1,2-mannosidase